MIAMTTVTTDLKKSGKRGDRKKLSWIYRQKKRQLGSKNATRDSSNAQQAKNGRIIVRNLPFKVTEDDVRKYYERFGKIEEINLLKHPDGKPVGCGFVQYQRVQDASKAIFNTNKKEFFGRIISSSWAIPKSKFCEKLENIVKEEEVDQIEEKLEEDKTYKNDEEELTVEEGRSELDANIASVQPMQSINIKKEKLQKKQISPAEKQKLRKLQKEKNRKKRARVIIRNLSFKITEQDLRLHFSQFGSVEDVQILTKEDGKNIGCAFVQFQLVQSAAKAIHHSNLKPLLGRPIVVDWAVPKNRFKQHQNIQVKEENNEEQLENSEVKPPDVFEIDEEKSVKQQGSNPELESEEDDAEENEDSTHSSSENEGNEDGEELKEEGEDDDYSNIQEEKHPRRESHDIAEGKTVFLKNVPFSVTNEQLKHCMQQFGPVYYALVCIDPLTEHSKGTAFVKFRNAEDAEKCLTAGDTLQIGDQILEAHKALERTEVENKANRQRDMKRDSRHLYLVKEGVILSGSPAANGVSAADMAKRLKLEQWKSQMLRNLNMFVSRYRLVVHNLPPSVDDAKLRKIFERYSGSKAVIKEARVMRDLRNLNADGVGKSKEYGFISFTTHEDALHALRSVNNNPNVFSATKRPIVGFSIENRIMVNAKQRRIEKSRQHNPLWQGNKMKRKSTEINEKPLAKKAKIDKTNDVKSYTGMISKPGESRLRTKRSLQNQALQHREAIKKEKKKNKSAKKAEAIKKEQIKKQREPKAKRGEKVDPDEAHFSKLVNNYKEKLQSIDFKKSKWYET